MKAAGGGQRRCEGGRGQLGDAWGLCRDLVSQAEVGSFPLTHRVSLDKAAPQLSGHVCAGQMSKTPLWKFGNRRWGCQGVSKGWVAVPAEPCRAPWGCEGFCTHPTKPPRNPPGACAPGRGWRRDFTLRPGSTREVFLPPLCECERVSGCGTDTQKASSPKSSARPQRGARLEPGVPALGGLHSTAERQLGEKEHLRGALIY